MNTKTVEDCNLQGKRVLLRADYNVPMDKEGNISDFMRIEESVPTLKYILEHGASLIILTHLGRPKGQRVASMSVKPIGAALEKYLEREVAFDEDIYSAAAKNLCDSLQPGEVVLMENIRFYPEEEANDPDFAKLLSSFGDVFVNEAFSVDHRAHASTVGVADYLPAYMGLLLEKEIAALNKVLHDPARPLMAIIGGAKISDKIKILAKLLPIVDKLFIGGGMANTFLAAKGYNMQNSLVEEDRIEMAKEILQSEYADKLVLPVDVVAASSFSNDAEYKSVELKSIPAGWQGLDIGSKTIELFQRELAPACTILWNGPMGVFEMPNFAVGTKAVAKAVADSSAYSVVGGGDSSAAIRSIGMEEGIDHISTGGGASLKYLEGKELPGIAVCRG
ncbi:MAG: phosphoglycerate kinase [Bacillota bacterium]|nr:phosphoglycerate kinase [Bacillota bacterium]